MKKRFFTLLLGGAALLSYAAPAPTILSIKDNISDDAIVYPESFETDTKEMLKNWYLQNYTVLDETVETKPSNDVPDQEYIKRLKSMPTIIEMPFNQVVKSYITMYTQRRRTLVEAMLGMSLYYMPIFEQALEKEGVPLELKYLPVIESALNPNAVSRVGATGLWQFMLGTAKGLGLEVNSLVDERRDPYRASDKAAKYLKELHNIYGDWSLAIAAYNCGASNVNKALRRAGSKGKDFWSIYPYLPEETRGYVPAFIAANYVMTYFKLHNISPTLAKRPLITDTIHVTKRINLQQISDVLNIPLEEIQVLNPHFRENVIPGDIRPYALSLPSQQVYSFIMSEDSIANHNIALYSRREVVEPAQYSAPAHSSSKKESKLVIKYHSVKKGEKLGTIANRYGVSVGNLKRWNGLKHSTIKKGQRLKIHTYKTIYVTTNDEEEEAETDNNQELASENNAQEEVNNEEATPKEEVEAKPVRKHSSKAVDEESTSQRSKSNKETAHSKSSTKETSNTSSSKRHSSNADNEDVRSSKKKSSTKDETKETSNKHKKASAKEKKEKSERFRTHTVKKGESLYVIAEKYKGISVADLKKANKMSGTKLKPGDKIKIPRE